MQYTVCSICIMNTTGTATTTLTTFRHIITIPVRNAFSFLHLSLDARDQIISPQFSGLLSNSTILLAAVFWFPPQL